MGSWTRIIGCLQGITQSDLGVLGESLNSSNSLKEWGEEGVSYWYILCVR